MKHLKPKFMKRLLASVMAALMTASVFTSYGVITASASDTLPYQGDSARGENQAYSHGYRCEDLLNWSPETDPYAQYLKAEIPLQTRNAANTATQANPNLSTDTEWMVMAGDYGNAFFDSYNYTNEYSQYLFNYWQYITAYGSWHGQPTEEVPQSMYQDEHGVKDAWQNRKFEFGVINLPNGGYTNAAHKNGVMSLGCIFVPRTGTHTDVLLTKVDGKFVYADKLKEMQEYYGFDGYFLNLEERLTSSRIADYKEFISYCTNDLGIYFQWYDGPDDETGRISYQNQFNTKNDSWLIDENGNQVANSIFLNYWWNKSKNQASRDYADSLGMDVFKTIFTGIEAGGDRWQQNYDLRDLLGEDGKPLTSIVSLGSEFVHDGLDEDMENGNNDNVAMRREKDEYQWMTALRERIWWSGAYGDPSLASNTEDRANYTKEVTGIDYQGAGIANTNSDSSLTFDGVAAYVTENSVINGDTFVTNFNTGHGMEWNDKGVEISGKEWSNIILQDILPTWGWWIEKDEATTRLNVDYDYGEKLTKTLKDGSASSFDFAPVGGYNGGDSLVVYGKVDGDSFIHLYKTDLSVSAASKMDVTFQKTSSDTAAMQLAVIFADDTANPVYLDIDGSENNTAGAWVTASVDLSAYAGKQIAAFGLAFSGEADNYQMNVGEMKYTSGAENAPATPTGFAVEKAYDTHEMTVKWDMADYSQVKMYHLYAKNADGSRTFLGGTYDEVYYLKDYYTKELGNNITLELCAVSADGTESAPATVSYDYSNAVNNVQVSQEGDQLTVSWDANAGAQTVSFETQYKTNKITASAPETDDTAVLTVPTGADADYTRYMITIATEGGETITYEGKLADTYAEVYQGKVEKGSNRLTAPLAKDWYQMEYQMVSEVTVNEETGETVYVTSGDPATITRYGKDMPKLRTNAGILVTLIDYSGNRSEQVFVPNCIQVSVSSTASSLNAGESYQMEANVENAIDPTVIWSISGNTDPNTMIDPYTGVLTVGANENAAAAHSITVTATSIEDPEAKASQSITVNVITVVFTDSYQTLKQYENYPMSVMVLNTDNQGVTYTLTGNTDKATQITADGILHTGASETGTLTVTAVADAYPEATATKTYGSAIMNNVAAGSNYYTNIVTDSRDSQFGDVSSWGGSISGKPEDIIDGNPDTGCHYEGSTELSGFWYALDLGSEQNIVSYQIAPVKYMAWDYDTWEQYTAEAPNEKQNLQVLKEGVAVPEQGEMSDEEYQAALKEFFGNDDNWTTIKEDCGASGELDVTGRYFRVYVEKGALVKGSWWDTSYIGLSEIVLSKAGEPVVCDIEFAQTPKTAYNVGETFEAPAINAVYTDGSRKELNTSDLTITGFDSNTVGMQTVTVDYDYYKVSYDVSVSIPYIPVDPVVPPVDPVDPPVDPVDPPVDPVDPPVDPVDPPVTPTEPEEFVINKAEVVSTNGKTEEGKSTVYNVPATQDSVHITGPAAKEIAKSETDTIINLAQQDGSTVKVTIPADSKLTANFDIQIARSTEDGNGIVDVNIGKKDTLPTAMKFTVNVAKIADVKAGDKVYIYTRAEDGTLTEVSNNVKTVSKSGNVSLSLKNNGTLVFSTEKIEDAVKLVDTVSYKLSAKTVQKGKSVTFTAVLPNNIAQVASFTKNSDPVGQEEAIITYKSSDTKIATVSASGKITGKKAGTVKITMTVKLENGQKKTFTKTITVK